MNITKYRKKPVVIEAVHFSTAYESRLQRLEAATKIVAWIQSPAGLSVYSIGYGQEIRIPTLEGEMTASPGDFIIKGVSGEFYPCKPDIFAATYEEVDE